MTEEEKNQILDDAFEKIDKLVKTEDGICYVRYEAQSKTDGQPCYLHVKRESDDDDTMMIAMKGKPSELEVAIGKILMCIANAEHKSFEEVVNEMNGVYKAFEKKAAEYKNNRTRLS